MAGKSKKFRVATEGATTDGRVIERVWIEQMAAAYDPKKYGARVNLEHLKGFTPDSPFKRYGDVLALTAEPVEEGKLALFAVIDPTEDLIAMTKKRQKIYTSIEVNPDFADTGGAYLVGLAVTDDPASLGTEMLVFSASAASNPLAHRKFAAGNLFSAAVEFQLEMDEEQASAFADFAARIKDTLGRFSASNKADAGALKDAVDVIVESQGALLERFGQLDTTLVELKKSADAVDALQQAHDDLVAKLNNTPANTPRDRTAGGNVAVTTDC